MSERKNIDKLFQEKLKNFESIPPQEVWDNIKIELEKKKKRRMIPLWWKLSGIAASLILGLWISNTLLFDNPNNKIIRQEESKLTEDSKIKTSSSDNQFKSKEIVVVSDSSNSKKSLINQPNTSIIFKNGKADAIVSSDKKVKNNIGLLKPNSGQTLREKSNANSFSFTKTYGLNLENIVVNNNIQDKEKTAENIKLTNQTNANSLLLSGNNKNKLPLEENKKTTAIANSQPNELEELLKEKEKKTIKQQKLNRWQINTNIAPVFYNSLADGSSLDPQFESNEKEYKTSQSFGVGINYALNKKVKLRTGLNTVSVNYNTNDVQLNTTITGGVRLSLQGSSVDLGILNNFDPGTNSFATGVLNQKMGYIELPLELSYKVLNKRFGIELIGGMSTLFLTQNAISMGLQQERINVGRANNLNDVHFSGNVGLGLKYDILKQLDFRVEPVFKYQINTFNSRDTNSKPYIFGIYSGIGYSF